MFLIALADLLRSDEVLSALVLSRIYPVVLPETGCFPAITYQIVGGSSSPTFETSGLQKVRVQFDAFSTTSYVEASGVREALRDVLNGFQGELSDGTYLDNVDLVQMIDFFDYNPREYRCMSEYYFYFNFTS